MKKIFTVMAIALMMSAVPVMAQFKIGIKGGVNVTSMHLDSKVYNSKNRIGVYFGPTALIQLPVKGLAIDVSALYDRREAVVKLKGSKIDSDVIIHTVQVPVNLRYSIGLGNTASVFFFAGPQMGFNVRNKTYKYCEIKDSNFNVNLGVGAMLLSHLQINANYNWAVSKTGTTTENDLKAGIGVIKNNINANAWQIGLAYYF